MSCGRFIVANFLLEPTCGSGERPICPLRLNTDPTISLKVDVQEPRIKYHMLAGALVNGALSK